MNKIKLFNISLAVSLAVCMSVSAYGASVGSRIKDTTLRLHVVANSDDTDDQQLKLRVRDAILESFDDILSAKTAARAKEIAGGQKEKMERAAKEEIKKSVKDYGVEVLMCEEYFETKQYGDFVLPAGRYDAVKVVIGEGKGENWWCVMFPPLCSGAVEDAEIVAYYESEAGQDVALIISGARKKVTLKLKSLEFMESLIEKIK